MSATAEVTRDRRPDDRRLTCGNRLLREISDAPDGLTIPAIVHSGDADAGAQQIIHWIALARDRGVLDELPPLERDQARRFVVSDAGRRLLERDPRQRAERRRITS